MLKIYNTLTKTKEAFIPHVKDAVTMYACGVTVYDACHIGHARSLYTFEVVRRYLKRKGFKVAFIRNITDVDDKIIAKAHALSKSKNISLRDAFDETRTKYIEHYKNDLATLKLPPADREPLATENIKEMIAYIEKLIASGSAYEKEGNVYFSVRTFGEYGKLSGKKIDDLLTSVRIESDSLKNDPLDFALWKRSKENEPSWESPWGKGRPGWHIECSVMSAKFLKSESLDIHGGGRDLVFPHHENEIAQSESITGVPFARYWMHHGLLTINGQKMAKSLGNFVTIADFISRYSQANILKLFFLSTHYAHPIDYDEKSIGDAKKQNDDFKAFFQKVATWKLRKGKKESPSSAQDTKKIDSLCADIEAAMDEDFNASAAFAGLIKLRDLGLQYISSDKKEAFILTERKLKEYFDVFALDVPNIQSVSQEGEKLLQARNEAREKKDFKEADRLRKELRKKGYEVSDTASGITVQFIRYEDTEATQET